MKRPHLALLIVSVFVALFLSGRAWYGQHTPPVTPVTPATVPPSAPPAPADPSAPAVAIQADTDAGTSRPPVDQYDFTEPDFELNPEKVAAMARARVEGDERAPPVVRAPTRDMPTADELADPALYLEYEARQQQKVYQSFITASTDKLTELKALLARGEREGIPEEQLEQAREKIRRMETMREEIRHKYPAEFPDSPTEAGAATSSSSSPSPPAP